MPRAKRENPAVEDDADEHLDEQQDAATLSGAIPEGELALARSVAKRLGWKPIEEWTRDPDKFVDAPEFLEQTPRILADLKERGERTAQAAAIAIEDARRQRVEEATRVIETSDDPAARKEAAAKLAGPPPQTVAWMAKNPWFDTDPDAKALAISAVTRAEQNGANIPDALAAGEEAVRKRFPEYFSTGTEQRLSDVRRAAPLAPQVQQGSRAPSNQGPKEKGFADIPRSDREAFRTNLLKHFMAHGQTQEQSEARYARSYWKSGVPDPSERGDELYPLNPTSSNVWAKRRGSTHV
jgi:hypothetical protein